jgi:hypothetical protein
MQDYKIALESKPLMATLSTNCCLRQRSEVFSNCQDSMEVPKLGNVKISVQK